MDTSATLKRYLVAMAVLGIATAVAVTAIEGYPPLPLTEYWFLLLVAGMLLGEFFPIQVHGEEGEETFSTTFGLALLLLVGVAPVILLQILASGFADAVGRRPLNRILFNLGQLSLSWAAAGAVLVGLGPISPTPSYEFATGHIPYLIAAGLTFFVVNSTLVRIAEALSLRLAIRRHLMADFGFRAWAGGLLFALGPPVAATASSEPLLVPLIVLPMIAIHRSSKQASEMERLALHDALTELPNRAQFVQRAEQALRETNGERDVVVTMLDLDRFKEINDSLGHGHGDHLLLAVARRLTEAVGETGLVARFGGDEFAVLSVEPEGGAEARVPELIAETFTQPYVIDRLALAVDASVGFAVGPQDGATVGELFQRADSAMYRAKANRSRVERYTSQFDDQSPLKIALLADLREAVAERQMTLHYQPKVELATGRVAGVEALARWVHPSHGSIPPDVFIPMAEHTGLIKELTEEVIRMALTQAADWQSRGFDLTLAVNVSARNLMDRELPATIERLLRQHGVPAETLELEVTESTLMSDPARAAAVLIQLHELGVSLAIDDFGTGYSSLASINRLPVDTIKIDRSFVMNLEHEPTSAAIVRTTVELALNLRKEVVAEGVENQEAATLLDQMGCRFGQGFGLCRPVPADQLENWLRCREVNLALPRRTFGAHDGEEVANLAPPPSWPPAAPRAAASA